MPTRGQNHFFTLSWLVGKLLDEPSKEGRAIFEVLNADELILRVCLCDAARAYGDGGCACDGQESGIAEPRRTGELCAAGNELLHPGIRRIGIEREGFRQGLDGGRGVDLVNKSGERGKCSSRSDETGRGAHIDAECAVVCDDVRACAATDHAEIDRAGTEPFIGAAEVDELLPEGGVQPLHDGSHFDDGIDAQLWGGSMHGDALCVDVSPEAAFVFEDGFQ